MSTQIRRRGGTAAENDAFTGVSREITVDTTDNTLRVHDGATPGGHRLAKTDEVVAALSLKANAADTIVAESLEQDIIPDTDGTRALGSSTHRFAELHVGTIKGTGFGFENRLQNPLFQVDIEGNAGGVTVNNAHVVEGWLFGYSSDVTTLTCSRVAGDSVPYALRAAVTTGSDASIGTGQYAAFTTAIEGYDVADAKWGTADAKSVWVCGRIKAPTTGTYCIKLSNSDYTRSYVFEVSCTAGTWADFEKEIPGDTSGTWQKTNGSGLALSFSMSAGSTFQTTADTWAAGNYLATSNQANGLATNGNIYEIEDIRVSVGRAIKTEWRPYALDLTHCQRYFEKKTYQISSTMYITNSALLYSSVAFSTPKRSTPTMAIPTTVNSSFTGPTLNETSIYGFSVSHTGTITAPATGYGVYSWTASARMI